MKLWRNLPLRAEYWHFGRIVESEVDFDGPMAAANGVFTALWPVVRPLSVTLEMAARSRELPFLELDIPLPVSTWHLRELYLPAHVDVFARVKACGSGEHSEEVVPQLMPQALAEWLARAHAQQLVEGYVPALRALHMYYTRARLLEYQKPSAELALGPKTYTIPVEKREDGLWVSGPMRDTMTDPPIRMTLVNGDGRLGLEICVGWSPWIETGSAEAELLTACLHELENQGWRWPTVQMRYS
jgi:hypothetical protein